MKPATTWPSHTGWTVSGVSGQGSVVLSQAVLTEAQRLDREGLHYCDMQETRVTLFLFCLAGNTLLTASVGVAVVYFSSEQAGIVPMAIGTGIIAYAGVVAFYTLLAVWRLRRATGRQLRRWQQIPAPPCNGAVVKEAVLNEPCACEAPAGQVKPAQVEG